MKHISIIQKLTLTSLSLSLLAACSPAETPTTPSSPLPTSVPSQEPVPEPTAEPTTAPTAMPTAVPTAVPTSVPSAEPTATPGPVSSLQPSTEDISTIEKTTFNGQINDDTSAPLDGVTVVGRSLNSSVPYEETTTTAGGSYAFNNAPSGVQIEITATRAGYTTRRRVEVLKSNKQGDPKANKYDFGPGGVDHNGTINNGLSDLPEVTRVIPGRNASGVDPKTSFVVGFSEPMDKQSVEDTFAVRSYNARRLTVDNGRTTGNTVEGNATIATWDGTSGDALIKNSATGTQIWDKDAFTINWNSDATEVTFAFKEERLLPTDKDSNLVPDYRVSFANFNNPTDRLFKDSAGVSRNHHHFKLTDGPFEDSYKFAIRTDTAAPTISGITAQTDENQGTNGDAVSVRFSERMIIYSRGVTIAGGMDMVAGSETKAPGAYPGTFVMGSSTDANAVAKNYQVRIVESGAAGVTKYAGTWGALGGRAVFDTNDVTHKTVLLLPPSAAGNDVNIAEITNGQTLMGTVTFTDGTTANFTFTRAGGTIAADANTGANLAAALNGATAEVVGIDANATFSAGAFVGSGANTAVRLNVAAGATYDADGVGTAAIAKNIAFVTFTGGTVGAGAMNGKVLLAGATVDSNSRLSIYKPGDTVRISVNSTVLDPAGNSINTSSNTSSGNAS